MNDKKNKFIGILVLEVAVIIHSFSGVFSKFASGNEFWSFDYWIPFAISLGCTFLYALLWQVSLKKLPLITAFLGKSVGTVWVAVFGYLFFDEVISFGQMIGLVLVVIGALLVVVKDE